MGGGGVITFPPEPGQPPPPEPPKTAAYASFKISMKQTLTLPPGSQVRVDVRCEGYTQKSPNPGQPRIIISNFEARLWPGETTADYPLFQAALQPDTPPSPEGRVTEYRVPPAQGIFRPLGTVYRFEISISGHYFGTLPPIKVTSAVVSTVG